MASGGLQRALEYDDRREDEGMPADDRNTCHQCQSFADHAHHPHSNARMSKTEFAEYKKRRGF